MLKTHQLYVLIVGLFVISCKPGINEQDVATVEAAIIAQQKIAGKSSLDSTYTALSEAQKLIEGTTTISDSLKAQNKFLFGQYYAKKGVQDSAVINFHDASDFVKGRVGNVLELNYFYSAWDMYNRLDKSGDCITVMDRFTELLDEDHPDTWWAVAYYMGESTYTKLKEYDKALANNQKRIELLEKAKDTVGMVDVILFRTELQYKSGKKQEAYDELADLVKKESWLTDDQNRVVFGDYGSYLFKEGDYPKAKDYYLKSLYYKRRLDVPNKKRLLSYSYSNLAEVSIELKEYDQAQKYIDSFKTLGANSVTRDMERNVLTHRLKLAINTDASDEDLFEYLEDIFEHQNKEYQEKFTTELAALKKANEKEKELLAEKQADAIEKLRLENRFILSIVIAALLGAIGFIVYKQRQYRFERQSIQMQQRLLRSQMNPHFTYNTLYAIQNHIKTDQDGAVKYLLKFSRLLRLILENSMQNYVELESELESLKKYMDLQLLRFPGKFTYDVQLHDLEEDELLFIPPMLMQPFVENSIEHGFHNMDGVGSIVISLTRKKKFIECTIEDNGQGKVTSNKKEKRSASTQLIADFLKKATKQEVQVQNKADIKANTSGMIVTFLIPFKLTEDD